MADDKIIIAKVIDLLKQINLNNSNISIEAETGYDEATFIGTDKGFIALSKFFLEFVFAFYNDGNSDTAYNFSESLLNKVSCFMTGELHHFFDDTGEVYPVCACIAKTEDDKKKIVHEFR